jgi:hypothetical protein
MNKRKVQNHPHELSAALHLRNEMSYTLRLVDNTYPGRNRCET